MIFPISGPQNPYPLDKKCFRGLYIASRGLLERFLKIGPSLFRYSPSASKATARNLLEIREFQEIPSVNPM